MKRLWFPLACLWVVVTLAWPVCCGWSNEVVVETGQSQRTLDSVTLRSRSGVNTAQLTSVVPTYGFPAQGALPALIFGNAGAEIADLTGSDVRMTAACCGESYPVVLVQSGLGWDLVQFVLPLPGWWAGVYTGPDRERLWGVMASGRAGPAWELELVHSRDGGRSWNHLATLQKPLYWCEFRSFEVNPAGVGGLTIHLQGDLGGADVPEGYYQYRTVDWGHHWSPPIHSLRLPPALADNMLAPPPFGPETIPFPGGAGIQQAFETMSSHRE